MGRLGRLAGQEVKKEEGERGQREGDVTDSEKPLS